MELQVNSGKGQWLDAAGLSRALCLKEAAQAIGGAVVCQ